jgi:hypothetical protein
MATMPAAGTAPPDRPHLTTDVVASAGAPDYRAASQETGPITPAASPLPRLVGTPSATTSRSADTPAPTGRSTAEIVTALGASGIPEVALHAYIRAEETVALSDPSCGLRWWLLAAIGRVESNHGRFGGTRLRADGYGTTPIRGIPLDGRPGVALIRDTDDGTLDGDPVFDRAVGPMQFIPSTWRAVAADGNGDGHRDPDNLFDAALAAATYLCAGEGDLGQPAQMAAAVMRYNRSEEYVALVLALAAAYAAAPPTSLPDPGPAATPPPPLATPPPPPASVGWSPDMAGVMPGAQAASPAAAAPPSPATTSTTSSSATTTSTTSTSAATPTTDATDPPTDPACPPTPTTSSTATTSTTTPPSDPACEPTPTTATSAPTTTTTWG